MSVKQTESKITALYERLSRDDSLKFMFIFPFDFLLDIPR